MSRCPEFYDKLERDGNFCGLSSQSISEIKGYLELRDKVVKMGVEKALFYEHCPSGACRPVLRLADDGTRTEATNYIISSLKRGETITQNDLKAFVDMRLKKDAVCKVSSKREDKSTHLRTEQPADTPATAPAVTLADTIRKQTFGGNDPIPVVTPDNNPIAPVPVPAVEKHVAAAKVTINPVFTPDTYRESPFRTASQVKAGIAGEMYPNHIADANKKVSESSGETDQQKRVRLAEELLACYSERFQAHAREYIRAQRTWKNGAADFFYFGGEMLMEKGDAP